MTPSTRLSVEHFGSYVHRIAEVDWLEKLPVADANECSGFNIRTVATEAGDYCKTKQTVRYGATEGCMPRKILIHVQAVKVARQPGKI
jgi:hypothetical protein